MSGAAKPRLLLLTPDYPPQPGGIQVVSERLAEGMAAFDTQVVTLATANGVARPRSRPPAAVRRVGMRWLPHPARVALLDLSAAALGLRRRPDLTLSMHSVTAPAGVALRVAGVPLAQYFHADEIGARPRLARFAAERADLSIGVSRYTAELVRGTGARSSVTVIPNGVDLPADATALPSDRPVFVTVSRMQERYKGHDVLVRALALVRAKVPDVLWVVIGDGPLRPGIEQMARAHGVWDSCRFLGSVSDLQREQWLRRARLLAMPSRLPPHGAGEGFGIAYLEAAACAKPSVAGNVGGAPDAVIDGETGLLVDPDDPVDVAEAIARLLIDDRLAARLGVAARARAEAHAWPVVCTRVQAALLAMLDGEDEQGS